MIGVFFAGCVVGLVFGLLIVGMIWAYYQREEEGDDYNEYE